MSWQGPSHAPYHCRPCSECTGQVIYCTSHKYPIQAASASVPPNPLWDLFIIFLTPETSSFTSSRTLDILNVAKLPPSTPTIDDGVNFGMLPPFPPSPHYLIISKIYIALVVYQLQMKLDFLLVKVIYQPLTNFSPRSCLFTLFIMTYLHSCDFLFFTNSISNAMFCRTIIYLVEAISPQPPHLQQLPCWNYPSCGHYQHIPASLALHPLHCQGHSHPKLSVTEGCTILSIE